MSFSSEAQVQLDGGRQELLDTFSSDDTFMAMCKLAKTTYTIDVIRHDMVALADDLSYELASSSSAGEICHRLYFKLVERISVLGMAIDVPLHGTQITSQIQALQIYESKVDSGPVSVFKVRRFIAVTDSKTLVEESISGKCPWALTFFVERECKSAHVAQVARYAELLTQKS